MGKALPLKHLQAQTPERCGVSLVQRKEPEIWGSEDLGAGFKLKDHSKSLPLSKTQFPCL